MHASDVVSEYDDSLLQAVSIGWTIMAINSLIRRLADLNSRFSPENQ